MQFVQSPKYRAETISIVVPFLDMIVGGETITGTPTVTVSVFTGIDPSPSAILYSNVMTHTGNTLEQIVWQGVVGVIYQLVFSISTTAGNTYEKDCYLALLPQEGSAVSPTIDFYYTSWPYPIEYAEGSQSNILPYYFHLLLNPRWAEDIKSAIATQDSTLTIGAIYYNNYPPEQIKSAISPSYGLLISISAVTYNNPHEDLKNNIAAISGTLTKTVVYYTTYTPEDIKSTIAPQGGTLA